MDMFRQIDPKGVVTKQAVPNKVAPTDALDELPSNLDTRRAGSRPDETAAIKEHASRSDLVQDDTSNVGHVTSMPLGHTQLLGADADFLQRLTACPFAATAVGRSTAGDSAHLPVEDAESTVGEAPHTLESEPGPPLLDSQINSNGDARRFPVPGRGPPKSRQSSSGSSNWTKVSTLSHLDERSPPPSPIRSSVPGAQSAEEARQLGNTGTDFRLAANLHHDDPFMDGTTDLE